MRWKRGRGRGMIDDRRGQGGGFGGLGRLGGLGRGGGLPIPGGMGGGIGGLILVAIIIFSLFQSGVIGGGSSSSLKGAPDPNDDLAEFVGFVVEDVQLEWQEQFRKDGREYQVTKLVLFDSGVDTACGFASSDVGPFYCPGDRQVYLDLGFFEELNQRFDAPGDFAQAYVIAHEFGHHIQTLLGTERRVREEQQRRPNEANELSVRMELQADCYAGVWAFTAKRDGLLETGDIREGLDAAAAVGDDRIQRSAGQSVDRESWTHGSSEQRMQWFTEGFESGDPGRCDTFSGSI